MHAKTKLLPGFEEEIDKDLVCEASIELQERILPTRTLKALHKELIKAGSQEPYDEFVDDVRDTIDDAIEALAEHYIDLLRGLHFAGVDPQTSASRLGLSHRLVNWSIREPGEEDETDAAQ